MKKLLFILLLLPGVLCIAQTRYLVYQLDGKVMRKEEKHLKSLKIGQVLASDAVIWINPHAGVTLICENYSFISLNTAGLNKLAAIHENCNSKEGSITYDYFRFIWKQLTLSEKSPAEDRRQYMSNSGAVVRGCPGIQIDPIFHSISSSQGKMAVSWKSNLNKERLSFVVYNEESGGDVLVSFKVKNNNISMDTIKKYASGHEDIYWGVNVDENEICPRKHIHFLQKPEFDQYLDSLNKQLPSHIDNAEKDFMVGFILEAQHFLTEALDCYHRSVIKNPSNKPYGYAYSALKKILNPY